MSLVRVLIFAFALMLAPGTNVRAEEPAELPKELTEAFAWFDTLGYPSLAKSVFVRIQTGRWSQVGDGDPTPTYEYGVLLEENATHFSVFGLGLRRTRYEKKNPEADKPWLAVGHNRVDVGSYVEAGVAQLEAQANLPFRERIRQRASGDPFRVKRYRPPLRFRLLVLARICVARGATKPALRLWQHLRKAYAGKDEDTPEALLTALRSEIGREMRRACLLDFADPEKDYGDHARALAQWHRHFGAETDERVPSLADVRALAKEESARSSVDGKAASALSEPERIARWVYHLRDPIQMQAIFQPSPAGEPRPSNAFDHVRKLGFAAVPRLIEGLDDHRPARGVTWYMGYSKGWIRPRFWVTTIADRCLLALMAVGGTGFGMQMGGALYSESSDRDTIRKQIDAWWQAVRVKGALGALRDLLTKGGQGAVQAAQRVMERHGDDGWRHVLVAAKAATKAEVRTELVAHLGSRKEPEVLSFLADEVEHGPALLGRVTAAWMLSDRGDARGYEAMKVAFDALPANLAGKWGDRVPERVLGFMLHCGVFDGIRHVASSLDARPPRAKLKVIQVVTANRFWVSWPGVGRAAIVGDHDTPALTDPRCRAAAEDMLAGLLDDRAQATGISLGSGSSSTNNPHVADMSAGALVRLFPARYTFDAKASPRARARQRVVLANVWRKLRGKPALPVPSAPKRDHVKHVNEVVEVVYVKGGGTPDKALKAMLSALVGRPLTADAFVGIVRQVARQLPSGTSGIVLKAERETDLPGIVLLIKLTTRLGVAGGSQKGWDSSTGLVVGGKTVVGFNSGFLARTYAAKAPAWEGIHAELAKALVAKGTAGIEASIRLRLER